MHPPLSFRARSPFHSLHLCSACTSILSHQPSPSQFPFCLLPLSLSFSCCPPHHLSSSSPFHICSQSLYAHTHLHHLLRSVPPTTQLLPTYFQGVPFHPISLTVRRSQQHSYQRGTHTVHMQRDELSEFLNSRSCGRSEGSFSVVVR